MCIAHSSGALSLRWDVRRIQMAILEKQKLHEETKAGKLHTRRHNCLTVVYKADEEASGQKNKRHQKETSCKFSSLKKGAVNRIMLKRFCVDTSEKPWQWPWRLNITMPEVRSSNIKRDIFVTFFFEKQYAETPIFVKLLKEGIFFILWAFKSIPLCTVQESVTESTWIKNEWYECTHDDQATRHDVTVALSEY